MTRGKRWVWFFVTLALLSATASATLVWFNLSQQLTREKLAVARSQWVVHQPLDYDLEYTKQGSASGKFVVQVRKGKVISATMDDRPLEPRLYSSCNMLSLFDDIDRLLERDAEEGTRTFTIASFDPQDGHLTYFRRRSVTGSRQWIEIRDIKLSRLPPHTEAEGNVYAPAAAESDRSLPIHLRPRSNRLTRTNAVNTNFDETYSYDNFNQLTNFTRGTAAKASGSKHSRFTFPLL